MKCHAKILIESYEIKMKLKGLKWSLFKNTRSKMDNLKVLRLK